jgi:hypothetical protein
MPGGRLPGDFDGGYRVHGTRRKIDRARPPAIAFFQSTRGGNPRISGISPSPTPARVPSWRDVSRRGTSGDRVRHVFSGHFRTSRSGISDRRRVAGGRGCGRGYARRNASPVDLKLGHI